MLSPQLKKGIIDEVNLTGRVKLFDALIQIIKATDARLAVLEEARLDYEGVLTSIQTIGGQTLAETLVPVMDQALGIVRQIGAVFEATSDDTLTAEIGEKAIGVVEAKWNTFVPLDYVTVRSVEDPATSMYGRLISFDRSIGVLTLDVIGVIGSGEHTGWTLSGSGPPSPMEAKQDAHPNLAVIAALTFAADMLYYGNGDGTLGSTGFPAAARTLLAATTAALQRAALGISALGDDLVTAETQAAARGALGLGTAALRADNYFAVMSQLGSAAGYDVGGAANQIVQLDGNAKIPPYDASQLVGPVQRATTSNLTAGVTFTPASLGTLTSHAIDPTPGNYKRTVNLGAVTLTPPTVDSAVDLMIANGPGAGNITLSGFIPGAQTGDTFATTERVSWSATISNANPGVVSKLGHGLVNNWPVWLTTNGALPTGLSPNTVYYVRNAATNTFELATAPNAAASIATSSAGSGVHTVHVASVYILMMRRIAGLTTYAWKALQ